MPAPNDSFQMNRRRGIITLLISTTGMGLSGMFTRGATRTDFFGSELVGGESLASFLTVGRMLTGLVLFATLLFITRKTGVFRTTRLTPAIIFGGLALGVSEALYMVAMLLTSLANAVFLIYTGPLFCTILARIFRKEPVSPFQWVCLAAVFIGMLFTSGIVSVDAQGITFGLLSSATEEFPLMGIGNLLGLLSGVIYGSSLFFNGYRRDCDTTVRGVWNFTFASAGALAVACAMTIVWPLGDVSMSASNWVFTVILWVVCGPVALGLLLVAGRNLPAIEYSTIAYWECIVSLCVSVFVYREAIGALSIVGGILIVVGGALPAIRPASRTPKPPDSPQSPELPSNEDVIKTTNNRTTQR